MHDNSCSLYSSHNMHARSSSAWSIVLIIHVLLLLSVLNTANKIVLFISVPYLYCYCIFIISLLLFFTSCTLVGPVLTDLYYFSMFRSESRYRELIVERILNQFSSGKFSFFLDLSYSATVDDIVHDSVFHICIFIPILGCICIYVYAILLTLTT